MPTRPYKFQLVGIRRIQRFGGRVLLADDMGLGKTLQSLLWSKRRPSARPIVVVCPAGLKWNWEHEAMLHVSMRAEVLNGRKPPKKGLAGHHDLIVVNYDILGAWLKYLKRLKPQIVILDEAHYCKNPTSQRTKNVKQLCKRVPHVLALSGTPLTNRPAELFSILNIVRPDLYKSFYFFGHRYCQPELTPWGYQYKGAARLPELHKKLKQQMMIRRLKKDVLKELPDKSRHVVLLDIEDRAQYKRAETDFIGWLREQNKAKAQRAKSAQRLVRVGYLKRLISQLKINYVLNWIDDFLKNTDQKLVAFGVHKLILKQLVERYQSRCVLIDGSITGKHRQQAVDKFQTNRKVRLCVGNLQAAGVGINLTAATASATIELGWTPGEHTQAEDRLYRIGQSKAVQCYYLLAKGTLEEKLCRIIQEKQLVLEATLDGKDQVTDLDIFTILEREILNDSRT